jgi:hypothetical protein
VPQLIRPGEPGLDGGIAPDRARKAENLVHGVRLAPPMARGEVVPKVVFHKPIR